MESFVPDVNQLHSYFNSQLQCDKLVYNRVPKCGSRNIRVAMTRIVRDELNYRVLNQGHYDHFRYSNFTELELIARTVDSLPVNSLFVRHIHFIDFSLFNLKTPCHINVIRDPFNRMSSWYYYKKFSRHGHEKGRTISPKITFLPSFIHTTLTLDECVLANNPACMAPSEYFTLIPWFCGHYEFCTIPTIHALQAAKRNVVKYFPVVGYVENIQEFYQVAEKVYPHYFPGLPDMGAQVANESSLHANLHKIIPSNITRDIIMEKLGLEYDFYKFIKERFNCLKGIVLNGK